MENVLMMEGKGTEGWTLKKIYIQIELLLYIDLGDWRATYTLRAWVGERASSAGMKYCLTSSRVTTLVALVIHCYGWRHPHTAELCLFRGLLTKNLTTL